jgi:hypothetical protein
MNKWLWLCAAMCILPPGLVHAAEQAKDEGCHITATSFHGWDARQMSNPWVTLTFVPKLGGRLMQVEFDGHPYLFVNPRFEGKYIPSDQAAGRWINYGGDKIWPMPEGSSDEQHWVLESSAIDDSPYAFKELSQGTSCAVELDGPVDDKTGLQYSRQISIDANSPAIHFHAIMRNATHHMLRWSVQSVSQYNLANAGDPATFNRNFWAYTAVRDGSAYMNGFYIRSGLADDPSFSMRDNLFRLHWMYLSNEVWIDSPEGWLAVVDGESGYGMIERFHFDPSAAYPGKATVIFYKNGPAVEFDDKANPKLSDTNHHDTPFYMEAEINSPLVALGPGATYAFDTDWFPLHADADVKRVTEAGISNRRLEVTSDGQHLSLKASFSVVIPGHLQLRLFNQSGRDIKHIDLDAVSPHEKVHLAREIAVDQTISRISLHLLDNENNDWGIIDDAEVRRTNEP